MSLPRSGQISPSYFRSVGIVRQREHDERCRDLKTDRSFETGTTQTESRTLRPIPAISTAATGTPTRISSAIAKP